MKTIPDTINDNAKMSATQPSAWRSHNTRVRLPGGLSTWLMLLASFHTSQYQPSMVGRRLTV